LENIKLESEIVFVDGTEVLRLKGEIDIYTAPDFKAVVSGMLAEDIPHLVIDMSEVTYMDSSAFGVLLSAVKTLSTRDGSVNLACCNATVEKILGLTKLNTIFRIHGSVPDAVAAVKAD
jgi:anti-sigma B factor antagonist